MTLAELLRRPIYVSTAGFDRRWRELAATLPQHVGTIVGVDSPVLRVTLHSTGAGSVFLAETTTLRVKLSDGVLVELPAGTEASPRADLNVGVHVELLGVVERRGASPFWI